MYFFSINIFFVSIFSLVLFYRRLLFYCFFAFVLFNFIYVNTLYIYIYIVKFWYVYNIYICKIHYKDKYWLFLFYSSNNPGILTIPFSNHSSSLHIRSISSSLPCTVISFSVSSSLEPSLNSNSSIRSPAFQ